MLPIIQSLWIGDDLSNVEKLCVKSFLDHGHEFHLYTYSDIGGIPDGAVIKDANEILPENEIYRNQGGSVSGFADWFRYALLNKYGNFWVDMDVICIRPFSFEEEIVFGIFPYRPVSTRVDRTVLANGVLAFPQGHFFTEAMERACRNHNENMPWDDATDKKRKRRGRWLKKGKEGQAFGRIGGPDSFTKAAKHFGLLEYSKPFMYFYPLDSIGWRSAFDSSFADGVELYPNTYSIHLKNDRLVRWGVDKNGQFDERSIFEKLKKRHGIEQATNAQKINVRSFVRMSGYIDKNKRRRKLRAISIVVALIVAFAAGWLIGQQ